MKDKLLISKLQISGTVLEQQEKNNLSNNEVVIILDKLKKQYQELIENVK